LGSIKELNKAMPAIVGREEGVNYVVIDRVKDETAGLPEFWAVEEDVTHHPWLAAVRTRCVITGRVKECGVVHVKSAVGGKLEGGTLKCMRLAGEDSIDERMEGV
jgi:hypothetical protein